MLHAQMAQVVPIVEKAEAEAFKRAKPAAGTALAQRQERGGMARAVLTAQQEQAVAREKTLKLTQGRGMGLGR